MLRFANTIYLWGLLAAPLFLVLFIWISRWKKKAMAAFGDKEVVKNIIPEVSFGKPWLKFILFISAYLFLILALADPQIGSKLEEEKRKGVDVMLLLDVSNSMLAQDLVPSRLENAKRGISQLIDNLHNDRIGIVVFAGEAYVQLPMTTDYSAAKLFLNTINTNMVPVQGTAIGSAIDLGMKSLDFNNGVSKAMILMTDGENHEDDAVASARAAQDKGVTVHVIGLGSAEGAPIPIYKDGKQTGYHTDSVGQAVVSKLSEDMCREIAGAGNGTYVRATNAGAALNTVMEQVGKMQQKDFDSKTFKEYEDRFQIFLAIALLLLVAEFFISNKKNKSLSKLKIFEVKAPLKEAGLLLLLLLSSSLIFAQQEKADIAKGNDLYKAQKFDEAEASYRKSVAKKNQSVEGNFNLGDALYKQKKFDDAGNQFNKLATATHNKKVSAAAYHNYGNALLQQKKYEESIDAYKKALLNNPKDDQTRYNLAYAQQKLKQQQQQNKQDNKNNQNKQDQQNQQNKQDQQNKDKQDKDKKDQQDKQNQQNKQDQDKKDQQAGNQPDKLSKEDAQRMLDALNNNEQATQDKLKNKKLKGGQKQITKDW